MNERREELARTFTAERARLVSLAYRLTGSTSDADDVAQETWIRLQRADADASAAPRDLTAWLTTTATRLALDQLRRTGRRKETYVGPWLQEPRLAPASSGGGLDEVAALADELSVAPMAMLETPCTASTTPADDAGSGRIYAGVHSRLDHNAGQRLGHHVAWFVLDAQSGSGTPVYRMRVSLTPRAAALLDVEERRHT